MKLFGFIDCDREKNRETFDSQVIPLFGIAIALLMIAGLCYLFTGDPLILFPMYR